MLQSVDNHKVKSCGQHTTLNLNKMVYLFIMVNCAIVNKNNALFPWEWIELWSLISVKQEKYISEGAYYFLSKEWNKCFLCHRPFNYIKSYDSLHH